MRPGKYLNDIEKAAPVQFASEGAASHKNDTTTAIMVQTEGFAAAPPTPVIDRDGKGISPTINLQKHATPNTASKGKASECPCISIDTRKGTFTNSAFSGIDTVHLQVRYYTVADNSALRVHTEKDATTGEMREWPLYSTSYGVIEGTKAFYNHPSGLFRFTIQAHEQAYVNVSLPKLLYGDNTAELNTQADFRQALTKLEVLLMEAGIWTDLTEATLTRLDLCRTVQLESSVQMYKDVIRSFSYPRTEAQHYHSGVLLRNGSRQICIYDKGKEATGKDSKSCRVEYRLLKGRTVESAVGTRQVSDLWHGNVSMKQLSQAYIDATGKLFIAELPDEGAAVAGTGVGIDALVEALKDKHATARQAVYAIAAHKLTPAEREEVIAATGRHVSRMAAYNLRKKLEELQCYADLLAAATRTRADLYAELKKAFTEQTN